MPTMKFYPNGATLSKPGKGKGGTVPRGIVRGWTRAATRRNTQWLYSVDHTGLTGEGFAVTLTLRDCPADHARWHQLRRAFFERLRRMGLLRAHWVTEWQRRGVPHLHAAVWFPDYDPRLPRLIVDHWLALTSEFGAGYRGQHVTPIHDAVGWFQYTAKHAARGLSHYQRSPENIPSAWNKTGRIWGYLGKWPVRDAITMEIDEAGFYAFRRLVRSWRLADARSESNPRVRAHRIRSARRMLQSPDKALSEVRGVSEWLNLDQSLLFLHHLAGRGFEVTV